MVQARGSARLGADAGEDEVGTGSELLDVAVAGELVDDDAHDGELVRGRAPDDRASLGTAVDDVTQEAGTAVGAALVGTVTATIAGTALPDDPWPADAVATFLHGERAASLLVAAIAGYGASTLTASRHVDEH